MCSQEVNGGKFNYGLRPNARTCLPTNCSKTKQEVFLLSTESVEEVCIFKVEVISKDLTGEIFGFSGHARPSGRACLRTHTTLIRALAHCLIWSAVHTWPKIKHNSFLSHQEGWAKFGVVEIVGQKIERGMARTCDLLRITEESVKET